MERGYLKLWRKSLDSEVFASEQLWILWTWCLMKASHKKRFVKFISGKGGLSIGVLPGQFVFGRNKAAEVFGWSPSTTWNRMQRLSEIGCITIESNKQYSVVSICNWATYQPDDDKKVTSNGQAIDKQLTGNGQAIDTNKNVKNVKKVNNVLLRPDFISEKTWQDLLEHRKNKKAKNTERAISTLVSQIKEATEMKYTPDQCIDEMVNRNWTGFKAEWMVNAKVQPYNDGFC